MSRITLTKEISKFQYEWRNDPDIFLWTRQNGLISPSDMTKWAEKIENDPTIEMFGVIDDENSNEVGTCGLTSISLIHGSAEFSLLIDPAHQRQGLGRATLQELFKYGFHHLRLNCIWGETFIGNPAIHLFESLGMKNEGRLRQRYFKNGEYRDAYAVSILRKEAEEQSWYGSA